MSLEKPRLPRIERSDEYHVEDDTTHLWAVSYADFLMVLLSFFILFFSVDSDDKNLLIRKIVEATDSSTSEVQSSDHASVGSGGVGPGKGEVMDQLSGQAMSDILRDFKVEIQKDEKMVEFQFPDNVFSVGQFELSDDIKHQLGLLISKLKPFNDMIELTIVGHTDAAPLSRGRTRVLNDNFDLSVIRATRAVQFAVSEGFSPAYIAAKGSADSKRNSRTLSIVVKPLSP